MADKVCRPEKENPALFLHTPQIKSFIFTWRADALVMASSRRESSVSPADEATPLLARDEAKQPRSAWPVQYRLLLCGFMVSLSFGVTQVP